MRRLLGFLVVDKDKINQDEQTAKQKLDQVKDNFQKKDSSPAAPK
jgi:hypothetical protein